MCVCVCLFWILDFGFLIFFFFFAALRMCVHVCLDKDSLSIEIFLRTTSESSQRSAPGAPATKTARSS